MKSMRDFIEKAEELGQLHRIKAQVDWNLELSHIAKLNEEKSGPALLFENVKDYDSPVITSVCTTTERLALIMGAPLESNLTDLMRLWVEKNETKIPPKLVDTGPCKENIMMGDDIDLFKFPAPKFYPMDGGRFFGTAHFVLTKDPDTNWVNLGTYRLQLLDKNHLGTQFIKGKHSDIMLKKYQAMGKPMPVAVVVGCDPILFLMGAARVSAFESEYDLAGSIRGEAIEVVKAETNDLPVPATAEIVVEGEVDAEKFMEEGPFGEYTGYYSGVGTDPRNYIDVKCVTYRNNPIFWGTTVGRAVTDTHMTMALTYGSTLWQQLVAMKIPGIKSVYCPPEGSGRMIAIISMKQMYPGHADQVLTAAISTEMGAYGLKTVIVVDEDIDPWDIPRVLYALSFRFQP
ncbi:MAG: UbiD family decarboxylase, partial [Desulfobacterales bacterium]